MEDQGNNKKDPNIRCDKCNSLFQIKADQMTIGDSRVLFFSCPFCGKKYPFSVINPELNELSEGFRRMRQSANLGYAKISDIKAAHAAYKSAHQQALKEFKESKEFL